MSLGELPPALFMETDLIASTAMPPPSSKLHRLLYHLLVHYLALSQFVDACRPLNAQPLSRHLRCSTSFEVATCSATRRRPTGAGPHFHLFHESPHPWVLRMSILICLTMVHVVHGGQRGAEFNLSMRAAVYFIKMWGNALVLTP